jgi:hypothetical protein
LQKERGLVSRRYWEQAEDGRSGARKPECCPEHRSGGRGILRLQESAAVLAFRQKMETEEARGSDRRRGRVVEFCHAWIQSKLGLRPFQVRGLAKVRMEMLWTCLSYNLQPWMRLRKPRPTPAAGSIQKSAGSGKDGVDTSRTSQKDKISLAPQKPPCTRRFFTASNRRVGHPLVFCGAGRM